MLDDKMLSQAVLKMIPPEKRDYFTPLFKEFENGKVASFNLAAAFWSFFWLFYYRMPLFGLVGMVIFIGIDILTPSLLAPLHMPITTVQVIDFFAPVVLSVLILGFFSNWIYWWSLRHKAKRILNQNLNEAEQLELLAKKGGTNLKGILWWVGGLTIIFTSIMLLAYLQNPEQIKAILLNSL